MTPKREWKKFVLQLHQFFGTKAQRVKPKIIKSPKRKHDEQRQQHKLQTNNINHRISCSFMPLDLFIAIEKCFGFFRLSCMFSKCVSLSNFWYTNLVFIEIVWKATNKYFVGWIWDNCGYNTYTSKTSHMFLIID